VHGADVVFGNTAFNSSFTMGVAPANAKLRLGQSVREWCYELEVKQGKNVVDAVATVEGLELFIWSSLSDSKKWSGGKFEWVLHFDSKAKVVDYVHEKYPELEKKMSILQLGFFVTNWQWGQGALPWEKVAVPFPLLSPLLLFCCRLTVWIANRRQLPPAYPWNR
jgi:hypothetical protein